MSNDGDDDVTPEMIAESLERVARQKGITFCRYSDQTNEVQRAKLFEADLPAEHELLHDLKKLKANLNFKKTMMEQALEILKSKLKWKITNADFKEYQVTMTKRMRNMCRVVNQGEVKKNKSGSGPKWLLDLPWIERCDTSSSSKKGKTAGDKKKEKKEKEQESEKEVKEKKSEKKHGNDKKKEKKSEKKQGKDKAKKASDDQKKTKKSGEKKGKKEERDDPEEFEVIEDEEEEEESGADEEEEEESGGEATKQRGGDNLNFKFDEETMLCLKNVDGTEEWISSYPIDLKKDGADTDEVSAKWSDGTTAKVPGMTIGYFKILTNGKTSMSASTGRLWEKEQLTTKHDLYIKQRVDHCLLLSLFEQKNQICQIQLNSFGVIDEKRQLPEDSDILKKGLAILIPIAEKFAKNEIGREEVFPYRNREMQRLSAKVMISPQNV